MNIKNLHILPRVGDSWTYLYIEHSIIEQDDKAIAVIDKVGRTSVPCAALSMLLLGPGTKITHAAIAALAGSGCLVGWTGEQGVRFYAMGMGETRAASNLLRQAALHADPALRLAVARNMYAMRFPHGLDDGLSLRQIRGKEGARVRDTYAHWSKETGVEWSGRHYKAKDWTRADPINRALSAANSCLYGIAQAAIVATGYSPGLGFIHTGKMLSFVYDIADLYKAEITIPAAFRCTAAGDRQLERRVRQLCRDLIAEQRLLKRIVDDLERLFTVDEAAARRSAALDELDALPGGLWDPEEGEVAGGINYGEED